MRVHPSEEQAIAYYIQWKENKERKGYDPSSSQEAVFEEEEVSLPRAGSKRAAREGPDNEGPVGLDKLPPRRRLSDEERSLSQDTIK